MDRLLNDNNILGFVDANNFEKLVSKLKSEDFAIITSYGEGRTLDEVQSINSYIRKHLVKNNIKCYSLIFQNRNYLQEAILVFRNNNIISRSQLFDILIGVSSNYTKKSFLVRTNRHELRSVNVDGDVIYYSLEKTGIIKTIELAYNEIISDEMRYEIVGTTSPFNNFSRMAFKIKDISYFKHI